MADANVAREAQQSAQLTRLVAVVKVRHGVPVSCTTAELLFTDLAAPSLLLHGQRDNSNVLVQRDAEITRYVSAKIASLLRWSACALASVVLLGSAVRTLCSIDGPALGVRLDAVLESRDRLLALARSAHLRIGYHIVHHAQMSVQTGNTLKNPLAQTAHLRVIRLRLTFWSSHERTLPQTQLNPQTRNREGVEMLGVSDSHPAPAVTTTNWLKHRLYYRRSSSGYTGVTLTSSPSTASEICSAAGPATTSDFTTSIFAATVSFGVT